MRDAYPVTSLTGHMQRHQRRNFTKMERIVSTQSHPDLDLTLLWVNTRQRSPQNIPSSGVRTPFQSLPQRRRISREGAGFGRISRRRCSGWYAVIGRSLPLQTERWTAWGGLTRRCRYLHSRWQQRYSVRRCSSPLRHVVVRLWCCAVWGGQCWRRWVSARYNVGKDGCGRIS